MKVYTYVMFLRSFIQMFSFGAKTHHGDFVIEGYWSWVAARSIPPWSPDSGGGGGSWWLLLRLIRLIRLMRRMRRMRLMKRCTDGSEKTGQWWGGGGAHIMAAWTHWSRKGTNIFKKTAVRLQVDNGGASLCYWLDMTRWCLNWWLWKITTKKLWVSMREVWE